MKNFACKNLILKINRKPSAFFSYKPIKTQILEEILAIIIYIKLPLFLFNTKNFTQ